GELGAALGAARLGRVAATGAAPETVMTPPVIAATIAPDETLAPAFDEAYRQFRAAYPGLRAIQ
ncbi:xylulokinase, partial [Rhodovulum sulfidophilum]|nr:xylulokinase [Rhodovulum sulfidophilum]